MRVDTIFSRFLKTNTYLVGPELSKDTLVIDPAGPPRRILEFVEKNGLRVVGILNTHAHADHLWGNHALKAATGAPIMIHRADADEASRFSIGALFLRGRPSWSPKPDRILNDGDTVTVGTMDLEVIHVPGHSPGGICLRYKKAMFTGDALMAGAIGHTATQDEWQRLSQAIQDRIFILSDDIVLYPGHGPKTTIERERKSNIFVRHSPERIERWLLQTMKAASREQKEKAS